MGSQWHYWKLLNRYAETMRIKQYVVRQLKALRNLNNETLAQRGCYLQTNPKTDECPALRNEVTRRKPGVRRGLQPCIIRKGVGEVLQPPHELVLRVRS